MAYTKAQLEALAAQLLASQQPIAASQHRSQVQTLIDEMFSAQSRGNLLASVQTTASTVANDTALIFRNGAAFRIPLTSLAAVNLSDLGDVFISTPQNLDSLVYNGVNERWENLNVLDQFVPYTGATNPVNLGAHSITAGSFVRGGGTSSQFLKADGSVDSTVYQNTTEKGQPNGYAQLDGNAKLPIALIPDSLIGQVTYMGTWNAATNTPTLPTTPAVKGQYYVVSAAGTFVGITYAVGDWIISNGTAWEKVDNTDAVTMVFGRIGSISADRSDYASFYVDLEASQNVSGNKSFLNTIFANAGVRLDQNGTALPTFVQNISGTGLISSGSNGIGFNSANNLYFSGSGKGGAIMAVNNTAARTYTLQDANGTIAFTSDITSALTGYVTLDTAQTITAQKTFTTSGGDDTLIVDHTSGSGIAVDISKAGNGEGLRVAKTSGSGNAVTITGGLLSAENATFSGNIDANNGLTLAASGTANPTILRNTSGTTSSTTGSNVIGFNSVNNIFVTTQSRGGFILGFNNSVSNREYTLPDASGTIALTSNLSAYLPLSGGNLTGGLNGTSAIFTGNLAGESVFTNVAFYAKHTGSVPTVIGHNSLTGDADSFVVANSTKGFRINFPSNSSFTHTLPNASGTIALTSNLSAYLPLTGGTLTGALSGTSASFSGDVNSGTGFQGRYTRIFEASAQRGGMYPYNLVSGSGTDYSIGLFSESSMWFAAGGGVTKHLNIASTGAAAFSSSVTANYGGTFVIPSESPASGNTALIARTSNGANDVFRWFDGATQLGVFKNSGNVGIGTASPGQKLTLINGTFQIGGSSTFVDNVEIGRVGGDNNMGFATGGTERMRITSGGYLKASNSGSYISVGANYHEFSNSNGGTVTMYLRSHGSINGSGILSTTPLADTSEYFFGGNSDGVSRIRIYTNGNIQNQNNSYGSLSDIKLKENITDATPKLDDLLKVKVRNYNLIGEETKQIGVIAQELEEVFPSLVDESQDFEEIEVPQLDEEGNEVLNEEGEVVTKKERVALETTTKSVKYSVFVPMLIKAIQEQQAQIEELKELIKTK